MKRMIAVFLSLLFVLTMLPAVSLADGDREETEPASKSVAITAKPTDTTYKAGDAFNPLGMVLTYYDKYGANYAGDTYFAKYPGPSETWAYSFDKDGKATGVALGAPSTYPVKLATMTIAVALKNGDGSLGSFVDIFTQTGSTVKSTGYKFPGQGKYVIRVTMGFYPYGWDVVKYHTNAWTRSASFELDVVDKYPSALVVVTQPTQLKYFAGESFSPEGMVVKVEYTDGTFSDALSLEDFAYSPSRTDKLTADTTVTLTSLTYKDEAGDYLTGATDKLTVKAAAATVALTAITDAPLAVGGTLTLTATTDPAAGLDPDALDWGITDVTGTNVASFSLNAEKRDATVKALNVGTAIISVTARGDGTDATKRKASYTVTVTDAQVTITSMGLDKSALTLGVGKSEKLNVSITPANATNKTITWSIKRVTDADGAAVKAEDFSKYVTVDANGTVSAIKECSAAVVQAKTNDPLLGDDSKQIIDTCTVKVIAIPVQSITLSANSLELSRASSAQLLATVYPSDATYANVSWMSLDTSVATVDATGRVTVLAQTAANKDKKTVIIRATATSGVTADCKITVKDGNPVTELSLSDTVLAMNIGDTQKLVATVGPSNATDKTVSFTSNNQSVATVSADGTVTAVAPGSAVITVVTNGRTDANKELTKMCTVNVTNVSVGSLILSNNTLSMIAGDSATVTASIYPANSTIKSVTWTSSDKNVATVTGGKITGVGKGIAIIRALANDGSGAYADCIVSVAARIAATSVTLNLDSFDLLLNDTTKLVATIAPATSNTKTVTWKSSDSSIVSVSDTGLVSGLKTGYADITATADSVSKTIRVTVVTAISNTGTVANCKRRVNVRGSASALSKNLGYAYLGETYKVLGKTGSWYKIQYGATQQAFIWSSYINLSNKGSYTSSGAVGSTTPTTPTTPVTNPTKVTIVNCLYSVNVRAEASLTGTKLGYAKLNATYTYNKTVGEWCEIVYNGKTAYVHASFCSLS